jgi:hypothetical protein
MPSYPAPKVAVQPTCQECGSATYCGGPQCPSSTLQLAPDQVPFNQQVNISVPVAHYVSMSQTGTQQFIQASAAG